MDKRIGLSVLLASAIFGLFAPLAFALPTADNFGVSDVSGGNQGTYILVPVNITNAQNGPIVSLRFDILYDNSVINVVGTQKGDLTSLWDSPITNNLPWGTRVAMVYDGKDEHAIQNCSSGSVVLLKFSVIGEPGETTDICLNNLQLSDLSGENVGFDTAPTKNGTFTIVTTLTPASSPTLSPSPTVSPTVSPAEESEEEAMAPDDAGYIFPTSPPTIKPSVMPTTASPAKASPSPISSPSSVPAATSKATPSPPGFDAISAIAGLIAVSYLSLWRRKA